uniref:Cytochrome b6/f complex subunit VI n=1 Tax=Viburnum burejaeticum TaxID=1190427 RepID=A0A7M3T1H5_9DIPS|nr:cytochrome b6/f complex subunit VI [Viburnum burejaeticum]QES95172.1 cytochrome b6/f complex subunit VI [Viburnum burejaeticum]
MNQKLSIFLILFLSIGIFAYFLFCKNGNLGKCFFINICIKRTYFI